MGHIGLTPQSATSLGGFKAQGRTAEKARKLVEDARELEAAGCFSSCSRRCPPPSPPRSRARSRSRRSASARARECDGQVLVWHDLLGLLRGPRAALRQALRRRRHRDQEALEPTPTRCDRPVPRGAAHLLDARGGARSVLRCAVAPTRLSSSRDGLPPAAEATPERVHRRGLPLLFVLFFAFARHRGYAIGHSVAPTTTTTRPPRRRRLSRRRPRRRRPRRRRPRRDTGETDGRTGGDDADGARRSFNSAGCAACHTFEPAGSTGMVGPNLDNINLTQARGPAPGRERRRRHAGVQGRLSAAEIREVADFVANG
jgi:hypothetical protein